MDSFLDTGLNEKILEAVKLLGFEKPTPIQAESIPVCLTTKQDIIAFAQTGTGKTAAFGLPSVHMTDTDDKNTQTLILCPTRELCLQITKDLKSYSKFMKGLHVVAVYGGASIEGQIKDLRRGAQIVVGTPGRTKDLIKRKRLFLENVERVVLDEADEMLTMGFKEDLDAILGNTPDEKQTLLFSATMSREMASITKKYMTDPLEIKVARMNMAAENVKHLYYTVQARDKYELLKRIADMNPDVYGIVFCRTRRETKEIANKLMHDGYNADALHGDLSQAQRDEVMGRFRKRHLQLLIATDVAARGLDVNDLTHVINFNLPDDDEVYIHRSGRTGRAGKSGISIAITHTREMRKLQNIERKGGIKFEKQLAPNGKDICTKQLYALIDKIERVEVDEQQIEPFLPAIYEKLGVLSREDLIKHFVSAEFNTFLEYYKNARDINVTSNRRDRDRDDRGRRGDRRDRGDRRSSRDQRRNDSLTRLFINAGSNNKLTPTRLIGVINEGLDSGNAEIGKIEILKKFSFFEIDKSVESKLIDALKGKDFEGVSLSVEVASEKPGGERESRGRSGGGGKRNYSKGRTSSRRSGGGGRRKSGSSSRSRKKW